MDRTATMPEMRDIEMTRPKVIGDRLRPVLALQALAAAVLAAVVFLTLGSSGAMAQSNELQNLIQRVDRLQREISTLQRQVYSGGEIPQPAPGAPIAAGEDVQPAVAARLHTRLSDLENQLRNLTGQIEQANFEVSQVTARLDKLVGDVDFRLRELEARMGGGFPADGGQGLGGQGLGGQGGAVLGAAPGGQPGGQGVVDPATPQVLGEVPRAQVEALRAGQGQLASQGQAASQGQPTSLAPQPSQVAAAAPAASGGGLPGGSVKADYDYAFGLLRQANYVEAESALKDFLEQHADDPLAGNAKYWLGETYYVRGDFRQAAVTFAEGFKRYPESTKAADNLLKLGMSLAQLDKKDDSCGAFSELLKRYPDASGSVLQRASLERERLSCP